MVALAPGPIATAHNPRNLGIGLALQRSTVRHLNVIEVTAPQPPVSFAGARPRLRCAHREVPSSSCGREPATGPLSSKVPGAAVHKRIRPRRAVSALSHVNLLPR